jgi:hypothetical protein
MNCRRYFKFLVSLATSLVLLLNVGMSALAADNTTPFSVAGDRMYGIKPSLPEQSINALVEIVSAGDRHTCAVKRDSTLACWGKNDHSQSTPLSGTFIQVSAGDEFTCGVKSDGTLACWGDNSFGQSTPPAGTFTQVSTGHLHACGLKSDRTSVCWGNNTYGQSTPPAGTFIQVSAGFYHTCWLKTEGTVECRGFNNDGQTNPQAGIFTQISAGYGHNCGLKIDGTLACWGNNPDGRSTPPSGTFIQVSAGGYHTCGLKSNGTLACWGYNFFGESTPPEGIFTQVSTGAYHTCGLKINGTLTCWGYNNDGESTPPEGVLFGPPSYTREDLINAYANLRDTVKSAVLADENTIGDFNEKYINTVTPNWGKMVFQYLISGLTSPVMFGSDTLKLTKLLDSFKELNTGIDVGVGIGNLISGMGMNPSKTQIHSAIQKYFDNQMIIDSHIGGARHIGISQLLADIDSVYNDRISHLPNPLPDNYPTSSTISLLEMQVAQINASQTQEVFVPDYAVDVQQCMAFMIGGLSTNKNMMDKLVSIYGGVDKISTSITSYELGVIAGGLLAKGISALAIPVTIGSSTVPLVISESIVWGTVGTVEAYANLAGAFTDLFQLSTKAAMGYVAVQGNNQAEMDLIYKFQIFADSGSWMDNVNNASGLLHMDRDYSAKWFLQISGSMGATDLQVVSVDTPNVVIDADQLMGIGQGDITVQNNSNSQWTISAIGDITALMNGNDSLIVGLIASENPATVQPGEQTTLTFQYTVFRSSMIDSSGYQISLFVQGMDSNGTIEYSSPALAHFYAGISSQLIALSSQQFGIPLTGQLTEGMQSSISITTQASTQKVRFSLFMDAGSDFDLHLYDSQGRHTGMNYNTGQIETSIPGSSYSGSKNTPEWISLNQSGGETYLIVVNSLNVNGGEDFTVSTLETPGLSALLDSPGQISLNATNQDIANNFILPITEYGDFHSISNISLIISNLVDSDGHIILSSQFSLTPPSSISPGSTVNGSGEVTFSLVPEAGLYKGTIQVSGNDAQTNEPVYSTTELQLKITTLFVISGNTGVGGVTLSYTDSVNTGTVIADTNGNYSFVVSYDWSGTVTPSKAGYTFVPTSYIYTNVESDQTDQNFTALVSISGNAGVGGVNLSYIVAGNTNTIISDAKGNYSLTVPYGWSGIVTPSKQCGGRNSLLRCYFTPGKRSYTNVQVNQCRQNFILRRVY